MFKALFDCLVLFILIGTIYPECSFLGVATLKKLFPRQVANDTGATASKARLRKWNMTFSL